MNDDFENMIAPEDWDMSQGAIIKVIGVGGGGNNAVNYMADLGIAGVDFIVCNTDGQALKESSITSKIHLGCDLTRGRGAGFDPEVGKQAALESADKIKNILGGSTEMLFITAGMGGGTGTGAAPVIAKIAREMNILTVAIVTLPFTDEGLDPQRRALEGVSELKNNVDSLLLISNNKLYEIYGDLSVSEGFKKADMILASAAKGIAEIITKPGYINVDFADVKRVMKNSGVALLGTGHGVGENRAVDAVDAALKSPLLNNNSIKGATNILVNITSGKEKEIRLAELGDIMKYLQSEAGNVENIKRGVVFDTSLGDELLVTIVATGFKMRDIPELHSETSKTVERVTLDDDYKQQNIPFEINKPINDDEDDFQFNTTIENELPELEENEEEQMYAEDVDDSAEVVEILELKEFDEVQNTNEKLKKKQLTGLKKQDIINLEKIPAYKRKNISIDNEQQSNQAIASTTIEKTDDNKFVMKNNNSYLNPTVD